MRKDRVTPESLPAVTKLINSLREQKGKGQKTVQIVDRAMQVAKEQIKVLEKMKRKKLVS